MQKFFNEIIQIIYKHKMISVITLYIITRLPVFFYPINSDYYIFYLIGKQWFQGEKLYTELFDHKPPLIFFFNGILSLISDNIWIQRIILILISIISVYLFKKLIDIIDILVPIIFKGYSQGKITFLLISIFIFLSNLAQVAAFGNNTETLSLPFILLIFIIYFRAKYSESSRLEMKNSFFIGILISLAFLTKINILVFFVPIVLDIILTNKKDIKQLIQLLLVMFIGFILPLGLISYYFYSVGSFNDFIIASFTYSAKYASVNQFGNVIGIRALANNLFLDTLVLLPYLVGVFIYWKKIKGTLIHRIFNNLFLVLIFPIFSFLITGTFFTYYLLSLAPFMAIGYSLLIIYIHRERANKYFKLILYGILLMCVGISIIYSFKQVYNTFFGPIKIDTDQMIAASSYVRSNSVEGDKIYANIYGSTFYYFAERDNFSRFSSTSHILLDSKYNFGFKFAEEWRSKAEDIKPKFIIRDKQGLYGRVLDPYIDENYHEAQSFGEYSVWIRNGSK